LLHGRPRLCTANGFLLDEAPIGSEKNTFLVDSFFLLYVTHDQYIVFYK